MRQSRKYSEDPAKLTKINRSAIKCTPEIECSSKPLRASEKSHKASAVLLNPIKMTTRSNTRKKNSKRPEAAQENYDSFELPCKRQRIISCPCCDWAFPATYDEDALNRHVEMCLEGQGNKDITVYKDKLRADRRKNRAKRSKGRELQIFNNNTEVKKTLKVETQYDSRDDSFIECKHCNLSLVSLPHTFISVHLKKCSQEQVFFCKNAEKDQFSLSSFRSLRLNKQI